MANSTIQIVQGPTRRTEDPVRRVGRIKIRLHLTGRVASMPCRSWTEDGERFGSFIKLKKGAEPFVERVIYADQLHKVEALVEDDKGALESARRAYERKLAAFIERNKGAKGEAEFGGSVEAEFCDITGRGFKPFRSVELVEDNIPAPKTQEDRARDETVELMAQAMIRAQQLAAQDKSTPKK